MNVHKNLRFFKRAVVNELLLKITKGLAIVAENVHLANHGRFIYNGTNNECYERGI